MELGEAAQKETEKSNSELFWAIKNVENWLKTSQNLIKFEILPFPLFTFLITTNTKKYYDFL